MIDGFILLTPLLVLPTILFLACWGCTVLFRFAEPVPVLLPLTVETRFPLPEGANIDDLNVVVQVTGVTLSGDAFDEAHEMRNPELQNDDLLLYVEVFPSVPEGRDYSVVCDVHGLAGGPIIQRPEDSCSVEVSGELEGAATVHFDAQAGATVFTCGVA